MMPLRVSFLQRKRSLMIQLDSQPCIAALGIIMIFAADKGIRGLPRLVTKCAGSLLTDT